MKVIKIIRKSTKCSRVLLDSGITIKLPTELIDSEITESEIVKVQVGYKEEYIHSSLYKEPRKPKVPEFVRDMSDFDATAELSLLRALVRKNQDVLGRKLNNDEVRDLADDAFLHFWERHLYQGYNTEICAYKSYLSRAVRNYMIDLARSSKYRASRRELSLNAPLNDEGFTLQDVLADPSVKIAENLEALELFNKMQACVLELDSTNNYGVSYQEIFKCLIQTGSVKTLVEEQSNLKNEITRKLRNLRRYLNASGISA